ncbi:MAG: helix-turn-helix domain-containing protein [Silvanigrellaceae bacterium]|nr:helix-turn-helix domain-containing protein [Silvanigrellaceae bacterium]
MKKQTKQIKNPKGAGRKKLFQDKYHNEIIDSMKKGQSLSFFASKIGVSKQTVYNWINENQNFKESFEIAQTACQAFWETLALHNPSQTSHRFRSKTAKNSV